MALQVKKRISESAQKAKALAIATARENHGMAQDIVDLTFDQYSNGATFAEALEGSMDIIKTRALERYNPRICAALRRAGLEVPDGFQAEPEAVRQLISDQAGLDLGGFTVADLRAAVDGLLSKRLSNALGIEVQSVLDSANLQSVVEKAVRQSLENGTAEKLLTRGMTYAIRKYATWKREGLEAPSDRAVVLHRAAQARYRRTHKQVWT